MSKIWYRCIRRATFLLHSTQFEKDNSSKPPRIPQNNETAQNRAQAEQFAFDINAPGMVEVTNKSHSNPAEHQYTVSIDDLTEELMACTCPHHVHRNAFCKHMAAVENATDDGTLEVFSSEDDEDEIEPEYCDCDSLGDFPCWPRVRTGRKELPN
ncbi:SWIM zinc finger family protein [Haladaptatus pallidirubidus]|uniref:SWIM-type domain-containing protein n=1 Tax=Haladaptatus pallidirubidus TaxID=1008152 RepID=A0AAV3UPV1_9EURY|nr:SWIM zinc finger family protein [Haladaptatus pallidirubidus]